jgi:hypothetical protein
VLVVFIAVNLSQRRLPWPVAIAPGHGAHHHHGVAIPIEDDELEPSGRVGARIHGRPPQLKGRKGGPLGLAGRSSSAAYAADMSAALWAGWALLPAFEAVTGTLVTASDVGGSAALAFFLRFEFGLVRPLPICSSSFRRLRPIFHPPREGDRNPDPGVGEFCRVIFDKMQGGPAQFIAESSLRSRELEEPLPKAKSREKRAGLQGRLREDQGCKGAGSGITELGPTGPTIICSHGPGCIPSRIGTTESVSAVRYNNG